MSPDIIKCDISEIYDTLYSQFQNFATFCDVNNKIALVRHIMIMILETVKDLVETRSMNLISRSS